MRLILITSALLVAAGCAGSNLTIDTTDEASVTFDGLYPVKRISADAAWARPGADLSQYSKILLQPVGIEYRPGGESGRTYRVSSRGDHYEISERQKVKLKEVMQKELLEELSRSKHFTIVDEPGPRCRPSGGRRHEWIYRIESCAERRRSSPSCQKMVTIAA